MQHDSGAPGHRDEAQRQACRERLDSNRRASAHGALRTEIRTTRSKLRDRVLGKARGGRAMHHRVRVLYADAVGTVVVLDEIHHGIVRIPLRPIPLPLESDAKCGDRVCARLDDSPHGIVMSQLADVTAAIFDDVDLVPVMDGLHGRKGCAGFRPKTADRRENHGDVKDSSGFRESNRIADNRLPIKVRGSEQHLGLMINKCNDTVIGCKQAFFTVVDTAIV